MLVGTVRRYLRKINTLRTVRLIIKYFRKKKGPSTIRESNNFVLSYERYTYLYLRNAKLRLYYRVFIFDFLRRRFEYNLNANTYKYTRFILFYFIFFLYTRYLPICSILRGGFVFVST